MLVASDSFLLEEGMRVRSLAAQGLLGQILRIKTLGGDRAGAVCYVPASLRIYTAIAAVKASKKK